MKDQLKKALEKYIKEFSKKHDLTFEFAVNDNLLDVISFGSVYFFSIDDIVFDIDTNQTKGLIVQWLEESLESKNQEINYRSYAKGLRFNSN